MIKVILETDGSGYFKGVKASGHAGFAEKGKDIVCAGVSTLLGTALEFLQSTEGLKMSADVSTRGNLAFSVVESDSMNQDRLRFLADFLRTGLKDIAGKYPENVELRELN